jgi:hypothetical protein
MPLEARREAVARIRFTAKTLANAHSEASTSAPLEARREVVARIRGRQAVCAPLTAKTFANAHS